MAGTFGVEAHFLKGKAYLTFGEDRFLRAKSYKGSIAFTKLDL